MSTSSAVGSVGNFWSGLATGVGSGVINTLGSFISNKQNKDNSIELWKLNNEYNTPKNQMKRLEEAGLNPNLVYGGSAVTGNTSSQPSAPTLQIPKFAIDYTQAMLGSNLEKVHQEIEKNKTENKILGEQLAGLKYNNSLYLNTGLPTNAPWYAKTLQDLAKKWSSDPEKVNILKGIGESIYDITHPFGSPKNPLDFDLIPEKNGNITIEYLE